MGCLVLILPHNVQPCRYCLLKLMNRTSVMFKLWQTLLKGWCLSPQVSFLRVLFNGGVIVNVVYQDLN